MRLIYPLLSFPHIPKRFCHGIYLSGKCDCSRRFSVCTHGGRCAIMSWGFAFLLQSDNLNTITNPFSTKSEQLTLPLIRVNNATTGSGLCREVGPSVVRLILRDTSNWSLVEVMGLGEIGHVIAWWILPPHTIATHSAALSNSRIYWGNTVVFMLRYKWSHDWA